MGSDKAEPKGPKKATPMLYTRLNDAGTAFEAERNVIHSAYGLDGGGTLAAGDNGDVYVFWHAPEPGTEGEEHRRVWVAVSHDDGRTFSPEHAAGNVPTGACGCCGMSALVDHGGNVYAVYRSASQTVHRDIYILESRDRGQTFTASDVDPWKVGICVMSTSSLVPAAHGAFAAWETKGQIHFGDVDPSRGAVSKILSAPGESGKRKHPAIAVDKSGETLLAWTEGMGWKKGGSLSWQLYDASGRPVGQPGHAEGVPTWSLLAAVPRPGGGFTILY